jgi:hypothetical protein
MITLISVGFGAVLTILTTWATDYWRQRRETSQLADAIYQEIAYNYEVLRHWIRAKSVNISNIRSHISKELVFLAYDAAIKNPRGFYEIKGHRWMLVIYRELNRLRDSEILDILTSEKPFLKAYSATVEYIQQGDPDYPQSREKLRAKLTESLRAEIVEPTK